MGSTQRIDICQIVYKLITLLIMPTGAHTHAERRVGGRTRNHSHHNAACGAYSKFTLWMQNVIPRKVRTSYVMWTDKTLAINQRDGAKWAWHAAHTHTCAPTFLQSRSSARRGSAQMPRCRPNRLNTLSAHKFTSLIEILI